MSQLKPDAAYVRKSTAGSHLDISAIPRARLNSFDVIVLELLDTPHTVISLTRVICSGVKKRTTSTRISTAMGRLLADDLIELSPDS